MLIDSHCHLTDPQYDPDRRDVLARARAAGVTGIVTIGSRVDDIPRVTDLLDRPPEREGMPDLWGTAGVHPHEAGAAGGTDLDRVRQAAVEHPRIVAIGETGLDFFYDHAPRDHQEALFRGHLALAEELELPLVVHSREADELTAGLIREWGGRVSGVLHCYTGGMGLLHTALDLGWMISFTGLITFKKYDGQDIVRSVPRERIMVETDGPYLAPVPFRGRRNEPAHVRRVAEVLAEIRGEDPAEVEGYTTENAIRFFGLGA
jgi:TatD DNase family protein